MTATTSNPESSNYLPHVAPPGDATPIALDASRYARRVWAMVTVAITLLYLLLLNPYWVPGGDSELYIAVARNWALGRGHTFNGNSVSICPPGWPLLLAGAMKISPTFLFMKFITLGCMVAALSMWYWILLRFTTPAVCALVVLSTAIVQHVYSLSFWMHSDALFCVIASGAMLLACQINERRPGARWRIALLVILCIGLSFVRWAGILQWLLIAGFLIRWHPRRDPIERRRTAPWIALVLSGVATFATFWIVRQSLQLTPQQAQLARDAGAVFDENQPQQVAAPPVTAESKTVDIITARSTAKKGLVREYADRILKSGKWFAWFFWPPMRFIGSGPGWINWIDAAVGWVLLILLVAAIVQGTRRGIWAWPALGLYCAALCLNWPNPNARYLVPVAPLIIWGVIRGIELIGHGAEWTRAHRLAIGALFASVILCNGALYAVDLLVARSSRFYAKYEGGLDRSLIDACSYINSQHLTERRLAVSERYENLGRKRASKFGLRAAVMLTDLEIVNTPIDSGEDIDSSRFNKWARSRRVVQWYLYQQPISPWRLWHLRVPRSVQRILTTQPVGRPSEGWVLYHRTPAGWDRVEVPRTSGWPRRVPGM